MKKIKNNNPESSFIPHDNLLYSHLRLLLYNGYIMFLYDIRLYTAWKNKQLNYLEAHWYKSIKAQSQ